MSDSRFMQIVVWSTSEPAPIWPASLAALQALLTEAPEREALVLFSPPQRLMAQCLDQSGSLHEAVATWCRVIRALADMGEVAPGRVHRHPHEGGGWPEVAPDEVRAQPPAPAPEVSETGARLAMLALSTAEAQEALSLPGVAAFVPDGAPRAGVADLEQALRAASHPAAPQPTEAFAPEALVAQVIALETLLRKHERALSRGRSALDVGSPPGAKAARAVDPAYLRQRVARLQEAADRLSGEITALRQEKRFLGQAYLAAVDSPPSAIARPPNKGD